MHIHELETPAVVVDLDILQRNIQSMMDYVRAHNLNLRPHTKTHKIAEIANMQLQYGSVGLTVAKSEEAEVMADAGCEDILVAYPIYGVAKWERLARLARDRRVTVSVDSLAPIEGLAAAAQKHASVVGILVEFDVGMHRCGVSGPDAVVALAREVLNRKGLEMRGVMYYPGHVWNKPAEQGPSLAEVAEKVGALLEALQGANIPCPIVSGGSTPAARNSHLVTGTTEIRPGTYVFNDRNTLGVGACTEADIALQVLATVVSTSVPGRAIVDSGSKTLTTDRWLSGSDNGFGAVVGHPDIKVVGLSEEHGHLDISASSATLQVGQRVALIPNHVCPCVNLHNRIYFHRNGEVLGAWDVGARGKIR
jgi:D-serine deaminase-like pyridoxal phosphate-dependent protein